ncbi:hypothetical protein HDE_12667 [Halotydeus destructor]|nr:hypothetical protein HDE_12667 [Halotydeus destructor]
MPPKMNNHSVQTRFANDVYDFANDWFIKNQLSSEAEIEELKSCVKSLKDEVKNLKASNGNGGTTGVEGMVEELERKLSASNLSVKRLEDDKKRLTSELNKARETAKIQRNAVDSRNRELRQLKKRLSAANAFGVGVEFDDEAAVDAIPSGCDEENLRPDDESSNKSMPIITTTNKPSTGPLLKNAIVSKAVVENIKLKANIRIKEDEVYLSRTLVKQMNMQLQKNENHIMLLKELISQNGLPMPELPKDDDKDENQSRKKGRRRNVSSQSEKPVITGDGVSTSLIKYRADDQLEDMGSKTLKLPEPESNRTQAKAQPRSQPPKSTNGYRGGKATRIIKKKM